MLSAGGTAGRRRPWAAPTRAVIDAGGRGCGGHGRWRHGCRRCGCEWQRPRYGAAGLSVRGADARLPGAHVARHVLRIATGASLHARPARMARAWHATSLVRAARPAAAVRRCRSPPHAAMRMSRCASSRQLPSSPQRCGTGAYVPSCHEQGADARGAVDSHGPRIRRSRAKRRVLMPRTVSALVSTATSTLLVIMSPAAAIGLRSRARSRGAVHRAAPSSPRATRACRPTRWDA